MLLAVLHTRSAPDYSSYHSSWSTGNRHRPRLINPGGRWDSSKLLNLLNPRADECPERLVRILAQTGVTPATPARTPPTRPVRPAGLQPSLCLPMPMCTDRSIVAMLMMRMMSELGIDVRGSGSGVRDDDTGAMQSNTIKNVILTVVSTFLFLALLDGWPYEFFILLRVVVFSGAAYVAWIAYQAEREPWAWVLGIVAVLFNPILPLHLTRELWIPIDIAVGAMMLVSVFALRL